MTVFIFEGPDGAGKSFTALEFSRAVNFPIHHFGGPPESKDEIQERAQFVNKVNNIIFDRIPLISDIVYGPATRGEESIFNFTDLNFLISNEENHTDYKIIYCRPSLQTILNVSLETKPHKSQEHLDKVKSNILAIVSGYDVLMSKIQHIPFNRDYQTCAELTYALGKLM